MKHAQGLGQLIKARGPDRYHSELEMSLLKAFRGLVVGGDLHLFSDEVFCRDLQSNFPPPVLTYQNRSRIPFSQARIAFWLPTNGIN